MDERLRYIIGSGISKKVPLIYAEPHDIQIQQRSTFTRL